MRGLLLVPVLLFAAGCGRADPAPTPATTVDSEPFPRFAALQGLRLLPDRRVAGDRARVIVEGGPGAIAEPVDIEIAVTVAGAVQRRTARLAPQTDEEGATRWRGEAEFDASAWPDGEGSVGATVAGGVLGPVPFRVVRTAYAAVRADRDELAAWIAEANRPVPIWGRLPRWRNLDAALARPQAPYDGLRGHVLRAYRSAHLDRLQPYTVHVPSALDLGRPVPLLVLLHGSNGDFRNVVADEAAGQRFEHEPMLIANAGAFLDQEYRGLALQDVLGVIEDVCAKYPIDRARIAIQGISLGGRGALEAAALLPDRFVAASAQGVYGINDRFADPGVIARLPPAAVALTARADLRTWLPNLHRTPVECIVGLHDDVTPAYNGLFFAHLLRAFGGSAVERTFARGHDISMPDYDWATTRAWMLRQQRDPAPQEIRHRVACLRYGRSGWLSVLALQDYAGIGQVRGRLVERDGRRIALVETVNVAELEIAPPPGVAAVGVAGDGDRLFPLPSDGRLRLRIGRATIEPVDGPADPGRKRPGRSGPLWDAWSDPVLYVWDAQPGETGERLRRAAEASATWDLAAAPTRLRTAASDAVTAEERDTRTLIVFTADPARCPLLAGVDLPRLPDGELVAVLLRPAPWHPERSVVVVVQRAARPVSLHEFGTRDSAWHGDWVVGRPRPATADEAFPGVEPVAMGVFDGGWRPATGVEIGDTGAAFLGYHGR